MRRHFDKYDWADWTVVVIALVYLLAACVVPLLARYV